MFCLAMMADNLEADVDIEVKKTAMLQQVLKDVLRNRLAEYELKEPIEMSSTEKCDIRREMAACVRLGEQMILQKAMERISAWVIEPATKRAKIG